MLGIVDFMPTPHLPMCTGKRERKIQYRRGKGEGGEYIYPNGCLIFVCAIENGAESRG